MHRLDDLGRTIFNLELYGFEIHDVEGWRGRYPRTCRFWHDRLRARHDEACEEVGEATTRVWLAYLAASSIAFQRNTVRISPDAGVETDKRGSRAAADTGGFVSLETAASFPFLAE